MLIMKRKRSLITLFICLVSAAMSAGAEPVSNPVADPAAMVVSGNMRFTVLTPEMIRIEWRSGNDKNFEDNATFAVINRRLPVPQYQTSEDADFLHSDARSSR